MKGMVCISLVNFNNFEGTMLCLISLTKQHYGNYRVVIVDNCSPDGSGEELCRAIKKISLSGEMIRAEQGFEVRSYKLKHETLLNTIPVDIVLSKTNGGFAYGCNIGVRLTLRHAEVEYIWFLNNDTIAAPSAMSELIARMELSSKIALCGSTLIYTGCKATIQGLGGYFNIITGKGTPIGHGASVDKLPDQQHVELNMNYVIGASMMARKDIILEIGGMDERFFLYFEELDLALRIQARGYRLGWAPKSIIFHDEGGSIGSSQTGRPSDLALRYHVASHLRFLLKHRFRYLPLAILRSTARGLRFALGGDGMAFLAICRGMASFILNPRYEAPTSSR